MTTTTFIYRPKSGDRVFAVADHPAIRVVSWRNGSRHVQGGVRLDWAAAQPRRYWRNEARSLATRLVAAFGGIAWDEQGTISLVVPASAVRAVVASMDACATAHGAPGALDADFHPENLGRLLAAEILNPVLPPDPDSCGRGPNVYVRLPGGDAHYDWGVVVVDPPLPSSLPTYRDETPTHVDGVAWGDLPVDPDAPTLTVIGDDGPPIEPILARTGDGRW